MKEEWKAVYGYPNYEVSNTAKVRSLERTYTFKTKRVPSGFVTRTRKRMILKQSRDNSGYAIVSLYRDGISKTKTVHRIMATAFILNPLSKKEVNHKDGNKQNNSLSNLEWVTSSENRRHAFSSGLQTVEHLKAFKGENTKAAVLKEGDVLKIRRMYRSGMRPTEIARRLCIKVTTARYAALGITWKHLPL